MYNDYYNTNSIKKSPRGDPNYQQMPPQNCNCVNLKLCKVFLDQMKNTNSYFQNQYIHAQIQFASCNYFDIEKYVCCPSTPQANNVGRRNTNGHGRRNHGSWNWPGFNDDGHDSGEIESIEHHGGPYSNQNQFYYPNLFNNFQKSFKNMFHSPFLSHHEGIVFFICFLI